MKDWPDDGGVREPRRDPPDSGAPGAAGLPGEGGELVTDDASADYAGVPYEFFDISPAYVSLDCVNFRRVPEGTAIEDFLAEWRQSLTPIRSEKLLHFPH